MAITNHVQFATSLARRYLRSPRNYNEAANNSEYAQSFFPPEKRSCPRIIKVAVVLIALGLVASAIFFRQSLALYIR